jgi:hypothetical protein
MSDDMKKIVDFVKNNPRVMAQVLLSLLALASPLYSVVLTLSRATLNAFALVLVLNIVVYLLSHFFVSTNMEKKPRRQSTPDLRIATQTRAANTKQTNASNAQHAAAYKELASDMFGTSALNDSTTFLDLKRRHELTARRLLPQLFA